MNTWNWLLHFLIIFDLVAFGIYFGGDILFTAISKVQKKSKKNNDLDLYDFEIETAPQKRSLCVDSIRMLYSGEIDEFVEKELLPDAAETMNALSEAEKTAVSLLLKAYIGFLSEEATVDEQSFPMVKELLSYTQGSKEDGEKDAIDCLMEDTVSRTHRHREYYNNYQRYQLMQVDMQLNFRVSAEELAVIEQKMSQFGTSNREAYLRKMALDGYVVKLELPELKELVSLMRRSSNNLNQLTRKVHETGRVYDADLEDISQRQEQLWEGVEEILTQLSKLL